MGMPVQAQQMIVLTPQQLTELLESAVEKKLEERKEASDWIGPDDVARLLAVKRESLRKLVSREGLPCHQITERLRRFRRSEIENWMQERTLRPGAQVYRHSKTLARLRAVPKPG